MGVVPQREVFISVDIEASGPSPGTGSLVSIGACLVHDPATSFYRELRPIPGLPWDPEAEAVHGLRRDQLAADGIAPDRAMREFAGWIGTVCAGGDPIFVGFNAPFDWMFVADYFHRFFGSNPFGVAAIDVKSLFMGRQRSSWRETRKSNVLRIFPVPDWDPHHALDDAIAQADLMRQLLRSEPPTDPQR